MILNITIFSKDRAAQLDLLLRSIQTYFEEWQLADINVIYKASDALFEAGYEKCRELHPSVVKWFREDQGKSFKELTLETLNSSNEFTMFCVDDLLFKSKWSLMDNEIEEFSGNEKAIAFSMRLSKHTDYCYPLNKISELPEEIKTGSNTWDWTRAGDDWGYPMSIDASLFFTSFIKPIIEQINFNSPNMLEAVLAHNAKVFASFNLMMCYLENAKIVNVVANRVQDIFQNRNGNLISSEELNVKFLDGKRIKLESFHDMVNKAAHEEHIFQME